MKKLLPILFLAAAVCASAAEPPREIFPSDYKPLPCAPQNVCTSFTNISFYSAASKFLLRSLDSKWVDSHHQEMLDLIAPHCNKRATCMASPGRPWWFCNDVFASELRNECRSRYPEAGATHHDFEQCLTFVDTYSAGVDQNGDADWKKAQECTVAAGGLPTAPGRLEWWTVPADIPLDYTGIIRVFAIDADTHVPVPAEVTFENQTVYSTDSPTGRVVAYYTFNWPRRLKRVTRPDGHSDLVAPSMTLTAPHYQTVTAPVPTVVPKVIVTMSPASLRRGKNTVTIHTVNADTGKPVEMQVMLGEATIGASNQPLTIEIPKSGKHPDLWVTSAFDAYSDAVVAPAVK